MSTLSLTYSALGRHADALAMGEKTLELYRHELPANHRGIGEGSFESYALVTVWCFERISSILDDVQAWS
jgi:hypothetical protein